MGADREQLTDSTVDRPVRVEHEDEQITEASISLGEDSPPSQEESVLTAPEVSGHDWTLPPELQAGFRDIVGGRCRCSSDGHVHTASRAGEN
jgi:hypothetical protein